MYKIYSFIEFVHKIKTGSCVFLIYNNSQAFLFGHNKKWTSVSQSENIHLTILILISRQPGDY